MNILAEIPASQELSPGLKWGEGKKATFAIISSFNDDAIETLSKVEDKALALFIPSDWLLTREHMDQNWTINLPKGRGQETLYSTTFFWNPVSEGVDRILQFAHQKGWAVYTQLEDKLCMLIVNSKVGVDVDWEEVKGQLV